MSQVTINIPFDEEKLNALDFSLQKENTSAQMRLEQALEEAPEDKARRAAYDRDAVRPAMGALRESCDGAEAMVDKEAWPMPTYTQLIYGV